MTRASFLVRWRWWTCSAGTRLCLGIALASLPFQPGCERGGPVGTEATSGPRTASDLAGHPVDPLLSITNKAVVLIFLGRECPVSNRYAPEIRRLHAQFSPRGMAFWLVYPNADESAEAIRQHTKEYQLECGVLRDPGHVLVKRAGVTVTPEVAVFVSGARRVYRGRIDNRYVALGQERPEATQRDLEEVLRAIQEAKPVLNASTRAVGCYIPDL